MSACKSVEVSPHGLPPLSLRARLSAVAEEHQIVTPEDDHLTEIQSHEVTCQILDSHQTLLLGRCRQ